MSAQVEKLAIRRTYTEKEFLRIVGIGKTKAWELKQKGELPHGKCGRRIFYTDDHINKFLTMCDQPCSKVRKCK